jgi:hypothetical protein
MLVMLALAECLVEAVVDAPMQFLVALVALVLVEVETVTALTRGLAALATPGSWRDLAQLRNALGK